jgi:uncharacterized membrane protein YbhN (UPF0104 family)
VSRLGYPLRLTSFVSFKEQLLYILLGLIISFFPSLSLFGIDVRSGFILLTILLLSMGLFSQQFQNKLQTLSKKILKKDFDLPIISFSLSAKLNGFIIFYWLLWLGAFYCLSRSLIPETNLLYAFAFPLSVCYGVLAIILPGGIGVREGIIVAFLTAYGQTLETAITLSVVARLWFITGEIFMFLLSLYVNFSLIRQKKSEK